MITVTEPQVWVLIGVFAAAIFSMIGIVTTSFNRNLTTAAAALRDTMDARFATVDVRFEAVNARFDALDAKFSGKFDSLDRDIQALSRHVFGTDPH